MFIETLSETLRYCFPKVQVFFNTCTGFSQILQKSNTNTETYKTKLKLNVKLNVKLNLPKLTKIKMN